VLSEDAGHFRFRSGHAGLLAGCLGRLCRERAAGGLPAPPHGEEQVRVRAGLRGGRHLPAQLLDSGPAGRPQLPQVKAGRAAKGRGACSGAVAMATPQRAGGRGLGCGGGYLGLSPAERPWGCGGGRLGSAGPCPPGVSSAGAGVTAPPAPSPRRGLHSASPGRGVSAGVLSARAVGRFRPGAFPLLD